MFTLNSKFRQLGFHPQDHPHNAMKSLRLWNSPASWLEINPCANRYNLVALSQPIENAGMKRSRNERRGKWSIRNAAGSFESRTIFALMA